MNPLAAYMVSVLKMEESVETVAYVNHMMALEQLGYWALQRPVGYSRDEMPPCRISTDCRLVDQFRSRVPAFEGSEGFDVEVDVYADPMVADVLEAV